MKPAARRSVVSGQTGIVFDLLRPSATPGERGARTVAFTSQNNNLPLDARLPRAHNGRTPIRCCAWQTPISPEKPTVRFTNPLPHAKERQRMPAPRAKPGRYARLRHQVATTPKPFCVLTHACGAPLRDCCLLRSPTSSCALRAIVAVPFITRPTMVFPPPDHLQGPPHARKYHRADSFADSSAYACFVAWSNPCFSPGDSLTA